jgi:hypothetical protein
MSKQEELQEEGTSSQAVEVKRTPSGDQSLEAQGLDARKSGPNDDRAASGPERGEHRELDLDGLRDVRLAVQQGHIAEMRAQRDIERAFEQARIEVVDEQLRIAGMKARGRQVQSLLFLGFLISVVAVVAGWMYPARLAANMVFWAIAGTVFFMTCAAIIIFAATALGAFAEMIQLIRTQFRSVGQPSAGVAADAGSMLSLDDLRDKFGRSE